MFRWSTTFLDENSLLLYIRNLRRGKRRDREYYISVQWDLLLVGSIDDKRRNARKYFSGDDHTLTLTKLHKL